MVIKPESRWTIDEYEYDGDYRLKFDDSPAGDAFGRLRVGLPKSIFEFQNQYTPAPFVWENKTLGAGTITHLPLESSVLLSTGDTAAGSGVVRQTREYFRYKSGSSTFVIFTGVGGEPALGTDFQPTKGRYVEMGYGDDHNGTFFRFDDLGAKITVRSDTSGSPINTDVYRQEWNQNRLLSGDQDCLYIDFAKASIFFMDLEWLGVGRVRFGIVAFGKLYLVHNFDNTNKHDKVYMRTANLPLRYMIRNATEVPTPQTIKAICAAVYVEGGIADEQGYDNSADTTATLRALTTTPTIALAIRPKLSFFGQQNRAGFRFKSLEIYAETRPVYWRLIYSPVITGGTWGDITAGVSPAEVSRNITSITGGVVVDSGIIPASNQVRSSAERIIGSRYPFAINIDGDVNTASWVLELRGIGGSANGFGEFSWVDYY